jgi:polysaccharide biosynthesis/export protein
MSSGRSAWLGLVALFLAGAGLGLSGCQTIDFYEDPLANQVPPELEPGREKSLVSLPAYRIAPPDVLQIEVLKLVPIPPYRVQAFDVLQVQAIGTLMDQPINGFFLIEEDGTITLGPAYGKLKVEGMTVEEVSQAIVKHLEQILVQPEVSVTLARTAGVQEVTGQYLVGPDGTVNLRQYGAVQVAGKTIEEATAAVEELLGQHFDSPDVAIDVLAYNSKVYYVISEGAGLGDSVVRIPITGKETVLDALANVGGRSQLSSKEIWIARPAPGEVGCQQILPVDYEGITQGASAATNYQVLPGDRVFIAEDGTSALANWVNKVLAPVERIAGTISLGASTARAAQTLGRNYNLFRSSGY